MTRRRGGRADRGHREGTAPLLRIRPRVLAARRIDLSDR